MTLGRSGDGKGIVYVGSAGAGKVYAVEYEASGRADVRTVAAGLQLPTGVAYRDGTLFVGALARVLRFDGIDDRLASPPAPRLVSDRFPGETHHEVPSCRRCGRCDVLAAPADSRQVDRAA